MSRFFEILIPTIFYILPVGGATYTIGKMFYRQLIGIKESQEIGSARFSDLLKPFGTFILLIWGFLLCIFMIVTFWFPSIQMPKIIGIIGLILLVPYLVCVGALYGLSKAVTSGVGSATGVIKDLTDMVSEEQSEKKK
jgi:hypothetical protein